MALHILPGRYYLEKTEPYWKNMSDLVVTLDGLVIFAVAALALSFIAPLALLAVPFILLPVIYNWYFES